MRERERKERNRRNQFPSETTLGPPRVIVINHMGSKMRFWQMEQRHRCVVHISITVVARYRSNLRDSEESNDIFSKDCRTLSNREIYTGVRHRAVRSRRVPSGFRAAADCSIKYIHTNTHTPAPRSPSGVLKIADKHNIIIFNRNRRSGRGIVQLEKILSIGEMKGGGGGGSGRGSCP